MTGDYRVAESATADSSTVDAAFRQVVQLLRLVAQEEGALARLERCLGDLREIAAARAALADCTDAELAEAHAWLDRESSTDSVPMLPITESEAS